jgi:hypothetical protein
MDISECIENDVKRGNGVRREKLGEWKRIYKTNKEGK